MTRVTETIFTITTAEHYVTLEMQCYTCHYADIVRLHNKIKAAYILTLNIYKFQYLAWTKYVGQW